MTTAQPHWLPALAASLVLLTGSPLAAEQPGGGSSDDDAVAQVGIEELSRTPPPIAPTIQGERMAPTPAPGRGRMSLVFEGNRRWCTFPDDRVVKPPDALINKGAQTAQGDRHSVYTFGYQFTVAAVERSRPFETLMLFESPVFRTAVYRTAAKLGMGANKPKLGPVVTQQPDQVQINRSHIEASTLIPAWQELYRCTTLPESFDFDLPPGTYDVYMAFDILLRSGNWTHRTVGFGTDITVEAGRATRVDARSNIGAGARRELGILGSEFADPVTPAAQP